MYVIEATFFWLALLLLLFLLAGYRLLVRTSRADVACSDRLKLLSLCLCESEERGFLVGS